LLRVLGFDSFEGKKRLWNRRHRIKEHLFDNFPKFIQLCDRNNVNCPENNSWAYKAFPKKPKSSQEKSPVTMPRFKTTPNSNTKLLTNGGVGDHDEDEYGKSLECFN
jgi:hypothetical protein